MGRFKFTTGVVFVLAASLAFASTASAAPSSDDARALRYELRAMGAHAGQAIMSIGAPKRVGKTTVRPVRMEARTEGLAAKFMKLTTAATSWVNASWLPVRARWEGITQSVKRLIKASYKGSKVTGTDTRDGKLFRRVEHLTKTAASDIVSVFPWLMQQDMTKGAVHTVPVFDGRRIYEITITVGGEREVQLPIGRRKVIELTAVIRRGDVYKRDMTLLISAGKDRTPYKLSFKYGLLGSVEAIFTGQKRIAAR